jgi:NhaP-type Na+/H+ or K+/H+ antiporter
VFGGVARATGHGSLELVEDLGGLSNAITFIVFGAVLLGPSLGAVSASVVLYAVLSLTIVRALPVAVAMIGTGSRLPTVAFLGWFGPRGLASIVFTILIVEEHTDLPHQDLLVTTAIVTVGLSVLAHGLTAAPLANRYAGWANRHPPPPAKADGGG